LLILPRTLLGLPSALGSPDLEVDEIARGCFSMYGGDVDLHAR
jgi:hypothetical protein